MFEKLIEIYREMTGNNEIVITPKTKIKDGLELSSLGKVQLIYAIEEAFDIEIPNKAISSFKTVQNIVDYLEQNA